MKGVHKLLPTVLQVVDIVMNELFMSNRESLVSWMVGWGEGEGREKGGKKGGMLDKESVSRACTAVWRIFSPCP